MSNELYPRRRTRPVGPIVTGRVVRLLDGYSRELKVGQPILVAVLTAAGVVRLIGLLVTSVLRAGTGAGSRRKWKDLKKGPEYLVTPLQVRDGDNRICELELHGHLPQSALHPGDHIQLTVRQQKDPDLAPRIERIVNITSGQLLTPRVPTVWSHLGPPLVLQAMLGVLLLGLIGACTVLT
ncbi:hypothetical protein V6U90_23405 [Micromonospora sp. CPCC 206060]|uniref:hypothetical protein n=1 Tax=Micromonospora sp. CPCC 206060 TaxID=3122406 RepID=UPI002FF1968D